MISKKIYYSLSSFSKKRPKILIILLILSFTLSILMIPKNQLVNNTSLEISTGSDPPWGIHITIKADPRFSRVVSWYTNDITQSSVKYSVNSTNLNQTAQGSGYDIEAYYFHYVELNSLTPDTVYYYQCGSNSSGWSKTYQFQTAPTLPSRGIHFGAMGDCRTNRDRRRAVNNLIINNGTYFGNYPELILLNGDLVESGDDMELWRNYALDIQNVSANITVMPVQGNHEFGGIFRSYYKENFLLPENGNDEWYYSFSWGLAHFTALDSETHGLPPYTVQDLNWIKEDLELAATDPTVLWNFVYFHQPPFASASHEERLDIKSQWCPLFEQYGVDIVFNGHNHFYERSYPVNHKNEYNATGDPNYFDPEYPIYVISGAAGMGGCSQVRTRNNPYSAVFNGCSHWTDVNITLDFATNTTRLEVRVLAINDAGTESYLIDAFNITKPIPDAWFSATIPNNYDHPVTTKNLLITLSMIFSLAGLSVVVLFIIRRHLKFVKKQ